jgi:glutathione S-transferase
MSDPTLTVYGGWSMPEIEDFSPFCLKVKTYLRMIDVPYKAKMGDPRKAPKKKIPYIDDGGTLVADSGHIVDYLKKKHGDKLDAKLTPREHAMGHLVRRTLEESLYWPGVHSRWLDEAAWPRVSGLLKPLLPPVIGGLILNGPVRGGVRRQVYEQGTGRHTVEEIHRMGTADIDAIATILGDSQYLLGDAPTSYDAIGYGFLGNLLAFPKESPIAKRGASHANIVKYVERMKDKYWATADA